MVNDVTTELYYDGAWNDISTDVRQAPGHAIKWGRADEARQPSPSSMNITLDNSTGTYSPRNPLSSLYGKIARNTPIRVRLGEADGRVSLSDSLESYVETPDAAELDVTGDLDLRADVHPDTWRPAELTLFAHKFNDTGNQRSWMFWLTTAGELVFYWTTAGTEASGTIITSTAAVPANSGRLAVRATIDVNNGAAGNTVTFYTAPDIAGSWTQLGAPVVTAGTTSIFASTATLIAGLGFAGDLYVFEMRNGISGTAVANANFTNLDPDTESFTDSAGRVWTLNGETSITDPSIRFAGEVSKWPPRWSLSGNDVFVPIQAAGIRRRLGQGASPLRSPLFRDLSSHDNLVAYWPMEDGENTTTYVSALGHAPATSYGTGEPRPAAYGGFIASESIPEWDTLNVRGNVPVYAADADQRVMALVHIPEEALAGDRTVFLVRTTGGTAARFLIIASSGNLLRLSVSAYDGTVLHSSSVQPFTIIGVDMLLSLRLTQNGANIDYQMQTWAVGEASPTTYDGSIAGITYGRIHQMVGGSSAGLGNTAIGHMAIQNGDVNSFWGTAGDSLVARAGENARERISRLCEEEGVPLRLVPSSDTPQLVGPQTIDTFLNLVDTAAEVDHGILTDDREAIRLLYRPGASLYNQDATLTLNYATGQVAPSLEPVEDDQTTRNDVTVSRPGGTSAQATLETGALSVQAPPDGVGRYQEARTISVQTDGQLPNQAAWLLHLGTVDEARYPSISADLTATPALVEQATVVRSGDRVQITDPPAWLPPDTIDQLAQGGEEHLTPYRHAITYNCTPASPWTVAVADDDELGRADTSGCFVNEDLTTTETDLSVMTTVGPRWIDSATYPTQFPFDIRVGGEVMTVTAVTGTTSSQTFTVTRSVNGVVKAHSTGAELSLAQPVVAAL